MIQRKLIFISLISTFLFACNSGVNKKSNVQQTKDTVAVVQKEDFPKGQIIEQVICKSDATQSYSMYLPSTYSNDKTYPVMYAFDSHGTGKLPVALYKELAEQYGYILVGSNNSKNGTAWEESNSIADKLFADVQNRLSVNTQRVYLLGFSGGARVANGLAITNGAITGTICCGAAAPAANSKSPRNNYFFIGIVGTEDFNYSEMKKYDLIELAGHDVKHAMLTFNGKHEWPPKETMNEAFWWFELNEMRKNMASKNDALIKERLTPDLKKIDAYMQNKKEYEAFELIKKTLNFYNGLSPDLTPYYETYKALKSNNNVDKGLKAEEASWAKEEDLKKYYLKGFETNDFNWWQREITLLNQKIKNNNEAAINKRVLGYLSLAAYMQSTGALKQNAFPAAQYFCKIYVLVAPTNNEAYYLTASVDAQTGNSKEALNALSMAVKNGFDDLPRIQKDGSFSALQNTPEFQDLIKKISEQKK